jgi:hypothetical protein
MKKICMGLMLVVSSAAFAQPTNLLTDGKTVMLKNISGLNSFSNNAVTEIVIADEKRGGRFYKYTGGLAADNGVIFSDASGSKWKRIIPDNVIRLDWWGAAADGVTDDKPAMDRALAYYKKNTASVNWLQLSGAAGSLVSYRFNDTIRIDFMADIRGSVSNTILLFGNNSPGIKLRSSEITTYIPTIYLSGITLQQTHSAETHNAKEVGIEINCIAHLKDVTVSNFQGNGIYIHADAARYPVSNSNLSTFERVTVSGARNNGWLLHGGDVNIIDFKNCQAVACGAAGFLDNGFLGNNYINCHVASNSSPELAYQKGLCKYNGVVYYALHNGNSAGARTKLGRPDISPKDWGIVPDQGWIRFKSVKNYHVDSFYQAGGGYLLDIDNAGQNQYATLTGCYAELDNPPSYWNGKSIAISGDLTSVRSGIRLSGWFGALDVNTSVKVSHPKTFQTTFQTSNAFAWQKRISSLQGIVNVYDTTNNFLSWYDWITYDANTTSHSHGGNFILPTQHTPATYFGRKILNQGSYFSPFMQEMYLNDRSQRGNHHKRIYLAALAPAPDESDMTGDIILNSITGAGSTTLGWRKTEDGTKGVWEEISINKSKYNVQTGTSYTLKATDIGLLLTFNNASAVTLTVPAGLPAGFNCTIIQLGTGVVTIKAVGTTINNADGFARTGGQYTSATILMYAVNSFITQGKMQK